MKKELLIYLFSIGLAIFAFIFLLSINLIGHSVKEKCILAQERYTGDCVEALSNYLDDEENGFRSRNSAIWALGQLGDERALPVLKKYYTSYEGEKIDRSQELAQLELERAIGYMEGSTNITSFFWNFESNLD